MYKKILFVSYFFSPDNSIGAYRPTKMLKYLVKNHHYQADLLTVNNLTPKDDEDKIDNFVSNKYVVNFYKKKRTSTYSTFVDENTENRKKLVKVKFFEYAKKFKPLRQTIIFTKQIKYFLNQYRIYFRSKKILKGMDLKTYDYVFSTFSPICTHLIGKYIKRQNKDIVWIADFRDPVFNSFFSNKIFTQYEKRFVERKCMDADIITTVTKGYIQQLYLQNVNKEVYVLYNGFDPDDHSYVCDNIYDKFTLGLFGNLYFGKRDISVVIRCIHELIQSNDIDRDKIQIIYAGENFSTIAKQLTQYNLQGLLSNVGFVSRDQSLKIQKESHVLLLPSWNYKTYFGVIPGKFYEFLMAKTYIVGIVVGDEKNSELKDMIIETDNGFCYEEANDKEDYETLKSIIKTLYQQYVDKKILRKRCFNSEKYSYLKIAEQLHIILETKKKYTKSDSSEYRMESSE